VSVWIDASPEARETISQSASANGKVKQFDQLIEECAELIVAVRHYERGRISIGLVKDEMADVLLMLAATIKHIGPIDESVGHKLRHIREVAMSGKDRSELSE